MMKKTSLLLIAAMIAALMPVQYAGAVPYKDYPFTYEDFEDGTENSIVQASAGHSIADIGYGNSMHSMKIDVRSNFQAVSFPINLEEGKEYTLTCHIMPEEDMSVTSVSYFMYFASRTDDGERGREAYTASEVKNLKLKAGKWTELKTNFTFSGKANIVGAGVYPVFGDDGRIELRFGNGQLANITGGTPFTYYLDDLSVEPELTQSQIPDQWEEPEPEEPAPDEALSDEWQTENAAVSETEDIPGGECEAQSSLNVSQTDRNGYIYQDVYVGAGKNYTLSFWAKSTSAKGADIKPEIEYGENKYQITDPSLKFAQDWTHYSVKCKMPKDVGKEARFSIYMGAALKKRDYYIADIKLTKDEEQGGGEEDDPRTDTPEIRNMTYDGCPANGMSLSVSAEYLGKGGQTGLIQLQKQADDGGWASIKAEEFTGNTFEYTFTPNDVGQEVRVRIIPMDTSGQIGGYRILDIGTIADELAVNTEFTSGFADTVSARADITSYANSKNIICVLMLYDDENACVGMEYKAVTVGLLDSTSVDVSADNSVGAKRAKFFVWEGKSPIDTTLVSLKKHIEMKNE